MKIIKIEAIINHLQEHPDDALLGVDFGDANYETYQKFIINGLEYTFKDLCKLTNIENYEQMVKSLKIKISQNLKHHDYKKVETCAQILKINTQIDNFDGIFDKKTHQRLSRTNIIIRLNKLLN